MFFMSRWFSFAILLKKLFIRHFFNFASILDFQQNVYWSSWKKLSKGMSILISTSPYELFEDKKFLSKIIFYLGSWTKSFWLSVAKLQVWLSKLYSLYPNEGFEKVGFLIKLISFFSLSNIKRKLSSGCRDLSLRGSQNCSLDVHGNIFMINSFFEVMYDFSFFRN